jgi:hypothetical protein
MNEFHVLNGDALVEQTNQFLNQKPVCVAREILMEGPVETTNLAEFWGNRASFINEFFGEDKAAYFTKVVSEFEKIASLQKPHKIFLWFEYDLFCQVNFWFTLNLIKTGNVDHELYWVRPNTPDWKGFGIYTPEGLKNVWQDAYQLSNAETKSLINCWNAYQLNDKNRFQEILKSASIELQFLKDVVEAHFARLSFPAELSRPEKSLIEISNSIQSKDFVDIFSLFSAKEGIYGYGDLQVKKLWNSLLEHHSELLN